MEVTRDVKFLKDSTSSSRSNPEMPRHEEITVEKSNGNPHGTDNDYAYLDIELGQFSEQNGDDRKDLDLPVNDSEVESHGLEPDDEAPES